MDTFRYLFSDIVWLPLLEFVIVVILIWAIYQDVLAHRRVGGTGASVKRGEKSWSILLSFWALSIIIIEIIISSNLIPNHKVTVGLLNAGALIYLNLFSGYFKNKIIGWSIKLQNREDQA